MPLYRAPALARFFQCRLTTATGDPFADSPPTPSTVYLTPLLGTGNLLSLYDGTRWVTRALAECSVGSFSATTAYDLFAYWAGTAVALEKVAWTNTTTRATALTTQDSTYVKTGDATRLYVGSCYTDASGYVQDIPGGVDTVAKRYLWNWFNRVPKLAWVGDSTNTWTYTTATWRQVRASATNQLELFRGVDVDVMTAVAQARASSANNTFAAGIGVHTTQATAAARNDAQTMGSGAAGGAQSTLATYTGKPGLGLVYLCWNEIGGGGANTVTWFGDYGVTYWQMGLTAQPWC